MRGSGSILVLNIVLNGLSLCSPFCAANVIFLRVIHAEIQASPAPENEFDVFSSRF